MTSKAKFSDSACVISIELRENEQDKHDLAILFHDDFAYRDVKLSLPNYFPHHPLQSRDVYDDEEMSAGCQQEGDPYGELIIKGVTRQEAAKIIQWLGESSSIKTETEDHDNVVSDGYEVLVLHADEVSKALQELGLSHVKETRRKSPGVSQRS